MKTLKPREKEERVHVTATVAPRTMRLLEAFAGACGVSRGIILDRAVECLTVCDGCKGAGEVDDRRCELCGGLRVIPSP